MRGPDPRADPDDDPAPPSQRLRAPRLPPLPRFEPDDLAPPPSSARERPRADASRHALAPPPIAPPPIAPAAVPAAPPPELHGERPSRKTIVQERELLGDLTRQLVQTMNRTSYYEVGHPAYYAERDELFARLEAVLADQPQVGYLLQRGDPPEILVDGLTQGRVRMSEVLLSGVYELFVPRFVEYFDRHEIVLLAFRAGITAEELGRFTAILSRPVAGKHRFDISAELVSAEVFNVSVLIRDEVAHQDTDLPWQVRVCLARLRRDLRAVPMFRDLGHEALRRAKRQIFADTVRPLQNAELLKQLVRFASRIEKDIERVEGLEDLRITPAIIDVLAPRPMIDLARLLCEESARSGADVDPAGAAASEARSAAIDLCARRLAKEDPPEAEAVLRLLVKHRILTVEDLPIGLQEWLGAEAIYLSNEAGPLDPTPIESAGDVRVLAKVGRLALKHDRIDRVAEVAARLDRAARADAPGAATAIGSLLARKEVDDLAARFETGSARDAEASSKLFAALGTRGATALADRIVSAGVNAHLGRAYHLLERLPEGPTAVAEALGAPGIEPAALRLLLAIAAARPTGESAAAARPYADHAEAGVRVAALIAVIAGDAAGSAALVVRALDDGDSAVVEVALSALADRLGRPEPARARALAILRDATAETAVGHLEAALGLIGRFPGAGADREAAVAVVRGLHEAERARVGFLGLEMRRERHPGLVATIERVMTQLGGDADDPPPSRRSLWERLRGS